MLQGGEVHEGPQRPLTGQTPREGHDQRADRESPWAREKGNGRTPWRTMDTG